MARMINHIPIRMGLFFIWTKINWTGNIREFRNVMERLIILCGNEITEKDVITFARPLSQS